MLAAEPNQPQPSPTVTQQPGAPAGGYPYGPVIADPPPSYNFATGGAAPSPPGAGYTPNAPPAPYVPPPQAQVPQHNPGLEPLEQVDHLFIRQEVTDIFFNSRNHFQVLSPSGQPMYAIVEKTGAMMRFLGGGHQSFSLILKDMAGADILFMEGSPGLWGGGAGISVTYQGVRIGGVQQGGDVCNPEYNIFDQTGAVVLTVRSQDGCCCMGAGGTAEFTLLQLDGQEIGRIGKEWGGFGREFFTTADTFGVNFPMGLHVALKAVLLAAAIMIDFQFFERR